MDGDGEGVEGVLFVWLGVDRLFHDDLRVVKAAHTDLCAVLTSPKAS